MNDSTTRIKYDRMLVKNSGNSDDTNSAINLVTPSLSVTADRNIFNCILCDFVRLVPVFYSWLGVIQATRNLNKLQYVHL